MKFEVVCAWCGKHLRTIGHADSPEDVTVSHSICPNCKQKVMEEVRLIKTPNSKK